MDSLKQMTGTAGFMSLPDDQKRCQIELFEDCQRSKFVGQLQETCGCIPWAIAKDKHTEQVTLKLNVNICWICLQVTYCNPQQQLCVKNMTKQNHGCRTSCTGLHADVTHTDDSLTKFMTDQFERQQNNLARGI